MGTIILVAIIGAFISAIVWTLWYMPSTPMGKWHMQYVGFDKLSLEEKEKKMEEEKPKMPKKYLAQIFLSFITSIFIAFVTYYTVKNGGAASSVYFYVIFIWFCFTVPVIGQSMIWSSSSSCLAWKRFFSDSFSNLITFLLIAFVATLFF